MYLHVEGLGIECLYRHVMDRSSIRILHFVGTRTILNHFF